MKLRRLTNRKNSTTFSTVMTMYIVSTILTLAHIWATNTNDLERLFPVVFNQRLSKHMFGKLPVEFDDIEGDSDRLWLWKRLYPSKPSDRPLAARVVVHARMRTGSSLMGQYFSEHPDFAYLYEPGLLVKKLYKMNEYNDSASYLAPMQLPLVQSIIDFFNCTFEGDVLSLLTRNIWLRSQMNIKDLMTTDNFTTHCVSKRHRVVKTIRLSDIAFIVRTKEFIDGKVKIVHLVRDPRATLSARERFQHWNYRTRWGTVIKQNIEKFEKYATYYCQWLQTNLRSAQNIPRRLRKNFVIVRYEDLADRPRDIVPKLYDFVGLDLHQRVRSMIDGQKDKLGNGLAWRRNMPFNRTSIVQDVCNDDLFRFYGYVKVDNAEQLVNGNFKLLSTKPLVPSGINFIL
ncbi:carbohydrate sulfotransferase 4-like [Ptychodera flava]|uniref:carbohydrate sulfotransferase 4-like n=1 Tax=Ptychodera flava TaxID=63121 RepID=UPI00396A7621